MIIVVRKHLPIGSSLLCDCMSPDVQIEDVALALLGHQVNAGNYYHVFIETLPTWHNVLCKYLDLCNYDEGSQVQLWLLEERGEHLTGLAAHLPALNPLYSCLSPTPPRHIKEHTNYGKVSTNSCLCVCLGLAPSACPSPSQAVQCGAALSFSALQPAGSLAHA